MNARLLKRGAHGVLVEMTAAAVIDVRLSRRNLRDLLLALDTNGSVAAVLTRSLGDGTMLRVTGEENKGHYGARKPGPGILGPGVRVADLEDGPDAPRG